MITATQTRRTTTVGTIPVVVTLQPSDAGTFVLTAHYSGGTNIDELRRAFADERTAVDAHTGMVFLLDRHPVAAVIAFANEYCTQTPPPGRAANGDRGPAGTPPCEDAA